MLKAKFALYDEFLKDSKESFQGNVLKQSNRGSVAINGSPISLADFISERMAPFGTVQDDAEKVLDDLFASIDKVGKI